MEDQVEIATDLLEELAATLDEARDIARRLSIHCERSGNGEMQRIGRECELYLGRTLESFADDDQDNRQMGSIGSLAQALETVYDDAQ